MHASRYLTFSPTPPEQPFVCICVCVCLSPFTAVKRLTIQLAVSHKAALILYYSFFFELLHNEKCTITSPGKQREAGGVLQTMFPTVPHPLLYIPQCTLIHSQWERG